MDIFSFVIGVLSSFSIQFMIVFISTVVGAVKNETDKH